MRGPFVEFTSARDLQHAYLLKGALESAGIPVQLRNESLQGILGEIPMGFATAPRLLVPKQWLEAAQEVLDAIEAGELDLPEGEPTD